MRPVPPAARGVAGRTAVPTPHPYGLARYGHPEPPKGTGELEATARTGDASSTCEERHR
ncbi:hypothetical protein GCM10010507_24350 [Streptomyces cinnamoneus]|uniref:Uncharacterized protein n=1 Tax=Streptomyces cinnamoneus TaxID=53446 RepID=A0A918TH43_STRCJ|nr:hypothetical protein GCM10010507_24350 [Streptomyces cinnamoneus]